MKTRDYYREYVLEDHNHVILGEISKEAALALVAHSPFAEHLTSHMVGVDLSEEGAEPRFIMNKGAIRISPWGSLHPSLWVYNHDDNYAITKERRRG